MATFRITPRLEKENYLQRLRGQYDMDKGQLKKVAFYYRSVRAFEVLNKQAVLTDGLSVRQAENWLENFDARALSFQISDGEQFVNGFDSWNATHFEVTLNIDAFKLGTHSFLRHLCQGREGLYELAREMTDKFERLNKERFWEGDLKEAVRIFCEQYIV